MKIRVLYIIPSLNMGGAEMLLINHLNNIDNDKYSIGLMIVGYKFDLLDQIINKSVEVYLINATKFNYLLKIPKIFNVVNQFDPKIIHSHLYKANILSRLIKFRYSNVKVINHYHGLSLWMTKGRLLIEKATQGLVDKAIVVSDKSYELRLERENLPKSKLELCYNFINHYPEKLIFKKKGNSIVFGMACRLIKLKNIPKVIRFIKYLNDCGINSHLKIAGSGPELDHIISVIKDTESESYVELLGFQYDLVQFYKSIDIYIVSSNTEDLPLSMIEAMGYGCPVISSDVGGISLIVSKGEGLVIEKINIENYECISNYLANVNFEKAFKINRNLIKKEFHKDEFMNKMDRIYSCLINE